MFVTMFLGASPFGSVAASEEVFAIACSLTGRGVWGDQGGPCGGGGGSYLGGSWQGSEVMASSLVGGGKG